MFFVQDKSSDISDWMNYLGLDVSVCNKKHCRTILRLIVLPWSRLVPIPSNIILISTWHVLCTGQIQWSLRLDELPWSRRVHIQQKTLWISLFSFYECILMILRLIVLLCCRTIWNFVLLCSRTILRLSVLRWSRLVHISSHVVLISTLHVFCPGRIQWSWRIDVLF